MTQGDSSNASNGGGDASDGAVLATADLPPRRSFRERFWRELIGPAGIVVLALAMFGPVLISPRGRILSSASADVSLQFVDWRAFGFGEIRNGNFPLWNPHIFGGAPFFAGFQSALLYPVNWVHLFTSVTTGINLEISINTLLAGLFMYAWVRGSGLSRGAGVLAGATFMFSGAYFLHAYAGHLPHLALMPWLPLVLLAIDKVADGASFRWTGLGVAALTMMIFAGNPQYLYYAAIIVTPYVLLRFAQSKQPFRLIGASALMVISSALLAAIQLFPAMAAAGESVRSGGTSYEFASMFNLPPENLLTLLTPNVFGSLPRGPGGPNAPLGYFGRGYLWEFSVFFSVTGAVLTAFGGARRWKSAWPAVLILCFALVMALGKSTALYKVMFDLMPRYNSFRGTSKFIFFATTFACMLAAMGFDELAAMSRQARQAIVGSVAGLALITAIAAFVAGTEGTWRDVATFLHNTRESYVPPAVYDAPTFAAAAARNARFSIGLAAATLAAIAVLIGFMRRVPKLHCILLALAIFESFAFARSNRAADVLPSPFPESTIAALDATRPGERVLVVSEFANDGMSNGYDNIWGYDPGVTKRYAEYMAAAQGFDPSNASQYLQFNPDVRLTMMQLLRCGTIYWPNRPPQRIPAPLPVATLVPQFAISTDRNNTLLGLYHNQIDPQQVCILEADPGLALLSPGISAAPLPSPGTVTFGKMSTDSIELTVSASRPAILLITNAYSHDWHARAAGGASPAPQSEYRIMPADWALQAIPLAPGQHHIVVEYSPASFYLGAAVSALSLLGFAAWGIVLFVKNRRRAAASTSQFPAEMAA